MLFTIPDLLTGQDLERVILLAFKSKFLDGSVTAGYSRDTKNNQEMAVGEEYVELAGLVNKALDSSDSLLYSILPRYRTNPIVNRYQPGMYYKEHVDAPVQGGQSQLGRTPGRFGQNFIRTDYSMTLFLSDPQSYDGGELELRLFEQAHRVKLRPGCAVFYTTGIPHQVMTVTRGTRLAAVCWFQSQVRDVNLRRVIREQHALCKRLSDAGHEELAAEAVTVLNNLVRYIADI